MNTDILQSIDRATAGLCPCGAEPAAGSAYCIDDCTPTHISADTDTRPHGELATPMRWRPDLVTAVDDSDRVLVSEFRHGRYNAATFEYTDRADLHLRLDDGHRFVGVDADPGLLANDDGLTPVWQRLERELTDRRRVDPDGDPWSAFMERMSAHMDRVLLPQQPSRFGVALEDAQAVDWSGWVELGQSTEGDERTDWATLFADDAAPRRDPVRNYAFSFSDSILHIDPAGGSTPTDAAQGIRSLGRVSFTLGEVSQANLAAAFNGWTGAMRPVGEAARRTSQHRREAGIIAPTPPPDEDEAHPMLRAIEARRRNTNSGPERRPRPPRQVNPRRTR